MSYGDEGVNPDTLGRAEVRLVNSAPMQLETTFFHILSDFNLDENVIDTYEEAVGE